MIRHLLPFGLLILVGCNEPRGNDPRNANRPTGATGETASDRAKRETGEAVDAVGDLTADKRVEWELEMKEQLDELDGQMEKLGRRINAAQGEAKAKLQQEWDELAPQRERARQRLEELKQTSGKAWHDLRDSTRSAFDELREGVNRAGSRFEESENTDASNRTPLE